MTGGHFLGEEDRTKLIALARDGLAASRVTRRANALVLLDDGWSCRDVAAALLLDDDTVRNWRKLFEQRGIEGLTSFDMGGSAGFLSAAQEGDYREFRVWLGQYGKEGDIPWPDARNPGSPMLSSTSC